jgi:cyclophilin family peptidyl-prolyl cis-trans isomerase
VRPAFVLAVLLAACGRGSTSAVDDASASDGGVATTAYDPAAIARAEDLRRAKDVPLAAQTSHDVVARRRTARALARIADAASLKALEAHLADEDRETIAWAAYGLGYACKGHEDANVKALAARSASLPEANADAGTAATGRGAAELDPRMAVARALGRCGGPLAEQVLVGLLKARGAWEEPAAVGLGDLAVRKKSLGAEAMTALLEAVARKEAPLDRAFYALSRADPGESFGKRVAEAGGAALARPSDARILAIKSIGRVPKEKELTREAAAYLQSVVLEAKTFTPAERGEAARVLGSLGEPGRAIAAEVLLRLTPDKNDAVAIAALVGPEFHVLSTLIASTGEAPPKKVEPALQALATLAAPSEPKPALARRLAELRCSAALALARGAYDADVLTKCDVDTSEASQRARLTALLRRPLTAERKAVFRTFTKSDHLRIRELAIESIGAHPELGDAAVPILVEALASKHGGLVATAAELIHAHPERVLVLAESERKAALDPKAPPPTANPAQEVSATIKQALVNAINAKRPDSSFETRIALIEAAAAVHLPQAKHVAQLGCNDANPVIRERSLKALRALGETVTACDAPDREATAAPEIGTPLAKPAKLTITMDSGEVVIVLEPELSPITAARIASLAKTGFYKGVVVHRVVPGFVVQFGDPDGDGYGGSDASLRCETSPVSFAPLDVGMALAGRDTGSSQLFVTLSRTPHLDGEYTRVGRAEGDWSTIAQGDVITDVRVSE